MLRPGSAIKRKQKPMPQQIAQKQVSLNMDLPNFLLVVRAKDP